MKKYLIINSRNNQLVGQAQSLKAARRIVDRKDNEYGAYAHVIRNHDWLKPQNSMDVLNEMMGDWFN